MLIDSGFIELSFDLRRGTKVGLCCLAGIAANFLRPSHATTIQFLEPPMMESLMATLPDACLM
jgi:hypothetical protein